MRWILVFLLLIIGCQPPTDPGSCADSDEVTCQAPADVNINGSVMLYSTSSYFGMMDAIFIMDDGRFIVIDELGNQMEGNELCVEGKIPEESFDGLKALYADSGFYETKVTQDDDDNLICEGGFSVGVRSDGKTMSLHSPCVDIKDDNTEKALTIMNNLSDAIYTTVEPYQKPCRKGNYIKTYDIGNCQTVKEIREQYGGTLDYDETDNLSEIINNSRLYAGAYLRFDQPKKEWIDWTYNIDGNCYEVSVLTLDGTFTKYEPPLESVFFGTRFGPVYLEVADEFEIWGNGTLKDVKLKVLEMSREKLVVKVLGDKTGDDLMPREGQPVVEITDGYCLWAYGGEYCFEYIWFVELQRLSYDIVEE